MQKHFLISLLIVIGLVCCWADNSAFAQFGGLLDEVQKGLGQLEEALKKGNATSKSQPESSTESDCGEYSPSMCAKMKANAKRKAEAEQQRAEAEAKRQAEAERIEKEKDKIVDEALKVFNSEKLPDGTVVPPADKTPENITETLRILCPDGECADQGLAKFLTGLRADNIARRDADKEREAEAERQRAEEERLAQERAAEAAAEKAEQEKQEVQNNSERLLDIETRRARWVKRKADKDFMRDDWLSTMYGLFQHLDLMDCRGNLSKAQWQPAEKLRRASEYYAKQAGVDTDAVWDRSVETFNNSEDGKMFKEYHLRFKMQTMPAMFREAMQKGCKEQVGNLMNFLTIFGFSSVDEFLEGTDVDEVTIKYAGNLDELYRGYLFIKECYEMRAGYAVAYINDAQLQQAKRVLRAADERAKQAGVDTDAVWDRSVETFNSGDGQMLALGRMIGKQGFNSEFQQGCQLQLEALKIGAQEASGGRRKKDF